MTLRDALAYLLSLGHETLTIKLGLKNTETLLDAIGDPHRQYPAAQIAGTNGKGSVAVTLDSICRAAGIRTGLFTSPHLVSITERIAVDGKPISEPDFARLTSQVKTTAEALVKQGELETLPTFFEHVTAIALLAFREAEVELAILETGLGGRLDSTTAAGADIVAITPIAMDHEEYLGHSLAEIAAEKAAIIRPNVTTIVAPQTEEVLKIIMRQCESVGVEPRLVDFRLTWSTPIPARYRERWHSGPGDATADGRCIATFETDREVYENITIGLRGRHQAANALTALAMAEGLRERGFAISRQSIIDGIESARHPGRLEMWPGQPRILFDGAHNPAAAAALGAYLDEFVQEPLTMIFGAMRDKALNEMAAMLFPKADELILTSMDNPRAANLETLTAAAPETFKMSRMHQASSVIEALRLARQITSADGLICITGSLYLVGAVQEILSREDRIVAHQRVEH
ncbi:MAG TPA: Mur ligase family protein [Pyrinomonadaceae bacterium]|nr:Mur ligase family protein [Pyrinomonadaceae bacterium]